MISYLPFTHIAASPFEPLSQALGPLSVHIPCQSLAQASMHTWQEKGLITLHTPAGCDEGRVLDRLQAYKSWAQLHNGHIGDMVHFFNTSQGRPPMVDETAPSQIRTQVRHFGEGVADTQGEMLVQAALFLMLAQEYDQHQERLGSDLAAVAGMEQAMYTTIGGGSGDFIEELAPGTDGLIRVEDPGAHMTQQRLQAWTRVAHLDGQPSTAYITPSEAVFECLKELMADRVDLPVWYLPQQTDPSDLKQKRRLALKALSSITNLRAFELDPVLCGQPGDDELILEWVACPGSLFNQFLPAQYMPDTGINTLIGWVRSP